VGLIEHEVPTSRLLRVPEKVWGGAERGRNHHFPGRCLVDTPVPAVGASNQQPNTIFAIDFHHLPEALSGSMASGGLMPVKSGQARQ
jgi:hypothetical protein